MRPVLALLCILPLLLTGCSDDGDPAAADQAVTAPDAAAGDGPTLEGGAGDAGLSGDIVGPPPGLPSNLTMYINVGDSLAVGYPATRNDGRMPRLGVDEVLAYDHGRDL